MDGKLKQRRVDVAGKNMQDEDLEHRLVNFLYERDVPERRTVQLDVHGGTVVVSGRLRSRHSKWLCIECCRHVAGVIKLVDELEVQATPVGRHVHGPGYA